MCVEFTRIRRCFSWPVKSLFFFFFLALNTGESKLIVSWMHMWKEIFLLSNNRARWLAIDIFVPNHQAFAYMLIKGENQFFTLILLCKVTKKIMPRYDCKSNNIIARCHRKYTEKFFCSTLIILLCARTFWEKLQILITLFSRFSLSFESKFNKRIKQFLHRNHTRLRTLYFDIHLCD